LIHAKNIADYFLFKEKKYFKKGTKNEKRFIVRKIV